MLKDKQVHFGSLNVILFHSGYEHVSATRVAIFRVVRTSTQIE